MIPGVQRLSRVHQKWTRWRRAYWGDPLQPCPHPCSLEGLGHPRDLSSPEGLEQSLGVPLGVMAPQGARGPLRIWQYQSVLWLSEGSGSKPGFGATLRVWSSPG